MSCQHSSGAVGDWTCEDMEAYWDATFDNIDSGTTGTNHSKTWRAAERWGVADLDRSGYLSLIHSHLSDYTLHAVSDHGLPDLFGLSETATDESFTEIDIPGGALADPWPQPYVQLLVDVDSDGFTDVLRVYDQANNPNDTSKTLPGKIQYYRNQRTVSEGRLKSIVTAWNGTINLTYAFSTRPNAPGSCSDEGLPYVVEVIQKVEDEQGARTFKFGNGYHDTRENRFNGFGDAFVYYDNGRTTHLQFSTAGSLLGDLLTRAEYSARDTDGDGHGDLEFFTLFRYESKYAFSPDITPPYFNPLQGRCDFWLASPVSDPNTLEQACCNNLSSCGNTVLSGYDSCSALDSVGSAQFADISPGSSPLPGNLADLTPATPDRTDPPVAAKKYLFTAQEWSYDSDQRLISHYDHRDVDLGTADDIVTTYAWDKWNTTNVGKQLESITQADASSNLISTERRSNFADFNQPQTITEEGPAMCGAQGAARTWKYTYSHGDVANVRDPRNYLTRFARNNYGQVTDKTDAVGRAEHTDYDACRESFRSFQGMTVTTDLRDGFGRVKHRITDDGEGSPPVTEERFYDDAVSDPKAEPRSGVRYADGSVMRHYLDEWGRELRKEEGQDKGSGTPIPDIVAGTMISAARGYDVNGNLRFITRPYKTNDKGVTDTIAATWAYADEFGRSLVTLSPAHVASKDAKNTSYVPTSFWYQPKLIIERQRVKEGSPALDRTCLTTFDTTQTTRTCDGILRSHEEYDVLGHVVRETDGDGVAIDTTYDPFYRPCTRQYETAVTLYDGTAAKPKWSYEYDVDDLLQASVDPEGNRTEWDYDHVGRVLQQRFIEYGTSPAVVTRKSVYNDYTGAGGSRKITTTDVNLNATTTYLDGAGRIVKTLFPDSTDETRTYNNRGWLDSVTDVDGLKTDYRYDLYGRLDKEVGPGTSWERDYDYDAAGDRTYAKDRDGVETFSDFYWSGTTASTTRANTSGGKWTLGSWKYRADGKPVETFENGVNNVYAYDLLGRRTGACIGADASGTCGLSLEYEWSAGDRLLRETRGGSLVTQYVYDPIFWLSQVIHPDSTSEFWGRDIMGRARWHKDEEGVLSSVTYDGWSRKTQEHLPGETGTPRTFQYTFHYTHPAFGHVERHVRTEPDKGVWKTDYDFAGRLVQEIRPDHTAVRSSYQGTHLSKVEEGTLNPGKRPPFTPLAEIDYAYDASTGQLSSRSGPFDVGSKVGADYAFSYTWSPEGKPDRITGPNDETIYTWKQGVMTLEHITGVTDKAYSYETDYPRLSTIQTGTASPYRTRRSSGSAVSG